jgi:hypothetical protein
MAIALLLLLAAPGPVAQASNQWCEYDPLIVVVTPQGALVPVFVTNGARGLENSLAAQLASIRHEARPTGDGRATLVQVEVVVPEGLLGKDFETRSTISTGPLKTGAILATAFGESGKPMNLTFRLDVP